MNFVAMDFETANSNRHSVCSIGLVKVENGKIIDTYYSLVNPKEKFSSFNIAIHSIDEHQVKNAPAFNEIYDDITSFINGYPLVAHFAQFDINVFRDIAGKYELPLPNNQYFCSYILSKKLLQLPSNKLNIVAKHFEIEFYHHNALEDAMACAKIVMHIANNQYESLDDLIMSINYTWGSMKGTSFKTNKRSKGAACYIGDPSLNDPDHIFYKQSVCFTGTLKSMKRTEAAQKVVNIGGQIHPAISETTDYLIVGESDMIKLKKRIKSSKIKKAENFLSLGYDIEILMEDDFIMLIT
jgi:DNA polymerase-3 subunit epsilon